MPTDVVMPQMGESIFEGTITKWLKKAGDAVEKDEPLFEISTDKVDAEIPSPVSGVLSEIKVPEGATVQINTVVALVAESGEHQGPGNGEQGTSDAAATPSTEETIMGPVVTGGTDVVMPQMGESIFEGTITKWLKKAGDRVEKDEPLFEISTDKVDAEIPSPVAGILTEIRVLEGATVEINKVVGVIGGFALLAEPLVEAPDLRIVSAGHQGRHVQRRPHIAASAADHAFAPVLPAVVVHGRHAHQAGDLASVELAQFGQGGQQHLAGGRADAWHALEQLVLLPPDRAVFDGLVHSLVDVGDLADEGVEHQPDALADLEGAGVLQTVALGRPHGYQLATAGHQILDGLFCGRGHGAALRLNGQAKAGDDRGVDGVGLGQQPQGLGVIPHLAGIDDHDRPAGSDQFARERQLVAAGGL